MSNETENQTRLRRAKEVLDIRKTSEDEARKNLAVEVQSTKRAREKYNELFIAEENLECARRREGDKQ